MTTPELQKRQQEQVERFEDFLNERIGANEEWMKDSSLSTMKDEFEGRIVAYNNTLTKLREIFKP